jgi:hypothetical protein
MKKEVKYTYESCRIERYCYLCGVKVSKDRGLNYESYITLEFQKRNHYRNDSWEHSEQTHDESSDPDCDTICEDCFDKHVEPMLEELKIRLN